MQYPLPLCARGVTTNKARVREITQIDDRTIEIAGSSNRKDRRLAPLRGAGADPHGTVVAACLVTPGERTQEERERAANAAAWRFALGCRSE